MYKQPFIALKELASAEQSCFTAISPFITYAGIEFLHKALESGVVLTIITNLSADNVKCGVTSASSLAYFSDQREIKIYHCSNLHAKIYQSSQSSLQGSFNLTGAGLSLPGITSPNIEVFSAVENNNYIQSLVSSIKEASILVSRNTLNSMVEIEGSEETIPSAGLVTDDICLWHPSYPTPKRLFSIYANKSSIPSAEAEADFNQIHILPNLCRSEFNQAVQISFLQSSHLRELVESQVFDRDFHSSWYKKYSERFLLSLNAEDSFIVLYRWITAFFDDYLRRSNHFLEKNSKQSIKGEKTS